MLILPKRDILLITCIGLGVFLLSLALSSVLLPVELQKPVIVEVKEGESFRDVLDRLSEKGLIKHKRLLIYLSALTGIDRKIKRGFYEFSGSVSPYGVIQKLLRGDVITVDVTIPEGFNIWQIAERLQQAGLCDKETFLSAATDPELLRRLDIDAPSVEGYLYPDTYRFPLGIRVDQIITAMVENLRKRFTPEMRRRMNQMGLTERELLTIASLIEKEAKVDDERPTIAAVFYNRLKRGMPLESDPTAVYGIKDLSEGVTKEDLKRQTPYNTYLRKGLPPGPIASAGIKSIMAALYPADVSYLYFVSMNNGRHYFSTTLKEHLRAIKRFKNQR